MSSKSLLLLIPAIVLGTVLILFFVGVFDGRKDQDGPSMGRSTQASSRDVKDIEPRRVGPTKKESGKTKKENTRRKTERVAPAEVSITGVVGDEEGGLPDAWVALIDSQDHSQVFATYRTGDENSDLGMGAYSFKNVFLTRPAYLITLTEGFTSMARLIVPSGEAKSYRENFNVKVASSINLSVQTSNRKEPVIGAKVAIEGDPLTNSLSGYYFSQFIFEHSDYSEEGAEGIEIDRTRWQESQPMLTNLGGQFFFGGLSKGTHRLFATHSDYTGNSEDGSRTSTSLGAEEDAEASLLLAPIQRFFGRVVQAPAEGETNATPIPNAKIELLNSELEVLEVAQCGSDGVFQFNEAVAGATRLKASAPGFASKFMATNNIDNPDLGDIQLDRGATLRGLVVDSNDVPIAGATVSINQGMIQAGLSGMVGVKQAKRDFHTKTDGAGQFIFDDLPVRGQGGGGFARMMGGGGSTVSAIAPGYGASSEQVPQLNVNETKEVTIKLMQAGIVRGIVVNQDQTPIAGATVGAASASNAMLAMGFRMVFAPEENSGNPMGRMFSQFTSGIEFNVTSDEAGRFEFDSMTPGGYLFGAKHSKYKPVMESGVTVEAGEITEITLVLANSSVIYGTYYGPEMKAMPNADVSLMKVNSMPPETTNVKTDGSGQYRFEDLGPGTYRILSGKIEGFRGMQRLMTTNRGAIRLEGGEERKYDYYDKDPNNTTLIGRATLNGVPYVGTIGLGGGGFSGFSLKQTNTDELGNFKFEDVPLGSYTLSRGASNRNPASAIFRSIEIRVKDLPEQRVDVDFKTVTLSGFVKMANGAPLPDDVVVYTSTYRGKTSSSDSSMLDQLSTQLTDQVEVDEAGMFEIKDLSPDTYVVSARSETGGFFRSKPITARSDVGNIELTLDTGVGTLNAIVKNYVGTSSGGMGAFLDAMATFTIRDANGEVVNLGNVSGGQFGSDATAMLQGSEDGVTTVEKEGLPVGTWTITIQVPNYAPVTVPNVKIEADKTVDATFELTPAGSVEIQFMNDNLAADAVGDMRYTIKNSKGEVYDRPISLMDFMRSMMNPPDTTKKNTFVLTDLPPDRYTIEIRFPKFRPNTSSFTIESKKTTNHQVTLVDE